MRNIVIACALSVVLAGCEPSVSTLFLPMEPSRESIAARRRELTAAEKELISEAVSVKMKGTIARDFKWAPLVLGSRDTVDDYCGLVSGNDADGGFTGYSKFFAELTFANDGKLAKADVRSIAKSLPEYPTALDSLCVQDGYGGLPTIAERQK
jgi:hypothetical protein